MRNNYCYHIYPKRDPICVSHYPNPVNPPPTEKLHSIFGLGEAGKAGDVGTVYVHVPFCVEICTFCPFNKVILREKDVDRYMELVKKEIAMYSGSPYMRNKPIDSIYFGGGTPSAIRSDQMGELLDLLKESYDVLPDAQISFEGSPTTLTLEKLQRVRQSGANRISIGVQTFNEEMSRHIGLTHSPKDSLNTLDNVAKVGIKNVGIDLMYNLPEQTMSQWLEDVQTAINLDIKHITLFSLCVVPFTRFAKQLKDGDVPPVGSEDYEIDLFIAAREHLLDAGYVQYSVWDFARPEYIDKHVIWYYKKQKDLISHGPGAFGYINRYMYINQGKLNNYFNSLEAGHFPVEVGEKADEAEAMNGMMAKSLRMMDVHREDFKALFGVDPADHYKDKIRELEDRDLLEVTPELIRLTPKGQVWGNNVCKEFFSEKNKQSFEMRVQLAKGKKPGAVK